MIVSSSSFTLEHEQIDGSRWCDERHQMSDGSEQRFYYLLAAGDDAEAIMRERADALNAVEGEG